MTLDGASQPGRKSPIPREPPSYEDSEATSVSSSRARTPDNSTMSFIRASSSSPGLQLAQASQHKNVPFRPLKEQQAHIDLFGGPSFASLTTYSTGTRTEYFDILPSFQLFQSILKRNDFEFDEDTLGRPPDYGDMTTSSPTPPDFSPMNTRSNIDDVLLSVNDQLESLSMRNNDDFEGETEDQYLFSDNEAEEGLQRNPRMRSMAADAQHRSRSHSRHHGGAVTHESYGHSVLDNIDRLPQAKSSPLSIEIVITKDVPIPNETNEAETKLKEYSCGDVVNGYIIITNTLDQDVDFGLFTVSLECTIKAIHLSSDPTTNRRSHRILLKKLLKMYDLNASYNYGAIPSSAGIQYNIDDVDAIDGAIMGLPKNRILKAHLKYKKFITFKFPQMLLDNSCPHNILRHTMPPPSFGIDNTAFFESASNISVNKTLGYGLLSCRGSPVKVKDYAFEDISVSYTIEAKFIDKKHSQDQHYPVHTNDVNNPGNESKYIISKSSQYFLRFVPDIKTQVDTYSRVYTNFKHDTFDTIGIDGVLFGNLVKRSTWNFITFMNSTLEQEIQSALDKREYSTEDIKRKNLYTIMNDSNDSMFLRPSLSNFRKSTSAQDQQGYYFDRKMIGTHIPVEIYGKKKRRLLLSVFKVGVATLYAQVPDKLISYGSPRLIQKYNHGMRSEIHTPSSSSQDEFPAIHPVLSNMEELYNRDDDSVMKSAKIEIVFDDFEETTRPPSISSIKCNIVAWSYHTDYPIPVSFEHDFFYTKPNDLQSIIYADNVENTKENLLNLKDLVNTYIIFLKETKTYISQNTYFYLKGLSKLGVKKDTIEEYFQTILPSTHHLILNDDNWIANQIENGKIRWTIEVQVPLRVMNKNNICLPPSFQSCLVGRLYCLQFVVKLKGAESPANTLTIDVPVLVG